MDDSDIESLKREIQWLKYDRLVALNERHTLYLRVAALEKENSEYRYTENLRKIITSRYGRAAAEKLDCLTKG